MSKIFTKPFRPLDWAATPHDFTGDNQLGPHAIEKTQRYVYGTRFLMWNGQVFKYANAEAAVLSYHAAGRVALASACSTIGDNPVAGNIGDRHITWTTVGAARAEDDLAGGLAFIYDKATGANIRRNIVGNDASVGTTTRLFLDYPLEIALETDTPDAFEIFENIYGDTTQTAAGSHTPWLGVPNRGCAADYKYWLQTWGPCVCSVGEVDAAVARAADERGLVWGGNGTLHNESDHAAGGWQQAGYHLTVGASSYGPLFMLMCST